MACVAGRIAAVVHREGGKGRRADMAQVAVRISAVGKRNVNSVRIVSGTFNSIRTVVACPADTCDSAIVVTRPQPGHRIEVAGIAFGSCNTVGRTLPRGDTIIVATRASAWPVVNEICGQPCAVFVAFVAIIGGHPLPAMG
jgi:hypothetical protein